MPLLHTKKDTCISNDVTITAHILPCDMVMAEDIVIMYLLRRRPTVCRGNAVDGGGL